MANPDLRFNARSSGIHVPQEAQRTSLFSPDLLRGVAEELLTFVETLSELTTF